MRDPIIMDFERTADPTKECYVQVVEDRGWNIPGGAYEMKPVCANCGGTGERLWTVVDTIDHDRPELGAEVVQEWRPCLSCSEEAAIERVREALRLTRFSMREDAERVIAAYRGDTDD